MSSLLTKPLVQHHLSRVSPIQLRDFPLICFMIDWVWDRVKRLIIGESESIIEYLVEKTVSFLTILGMTKVGILANYYE